MKKSRTKQAELLHRLVTRRDFLGAGLIAGSSYLVAPKWLDLILKPANANAADCPTNTAAMIPFITIDLAGGMAMASNFVPMNAAREPIARYTKLGLGDRNLPIERAFNNAPFAGYAAAGTDDNTLISKFYKGLRSKGTMFFNNTAFCGICVRSRDDNAENPFSVNGLLSRASYTGSMMANLGTANSASGGRHRSAVVAPPAPLRVSRIADIRNSIGYSAAAGTALNQKQKETLASLVNKLNGSQARRLAQIQNAAEVQNLLDCAGIRNQSLITSTNNGAIDPVNDAGLAAVWEINTGISENDRRRVHAAMVYNGLMGNSGSVTIELGGYDYHDNTRTTGDRKDEEAGKLVGQILESARLLNKPVFVYVTSDGSVFSPDSAARDAVWQGDRGEAGAAYMFYFNPQGRPAFRDFQLGQYTDGQVVDERSPVGAKPDIAAAAVFANWLKANNKMDLLEPIAGRILSGVNVNSLLVL